MIITDKAINLIRSNTGAKNRLAFELGCSIHTVERWIKDNDRNGDLTKVTAVNVISEETGLSFQEILEKYKFERSIETQI